MTARSFNIRIDDHFKCIVNNCIDFDGQSLDSTYAEHILSSNHQFTTEFEALHISSERYIIQYLEKFEIYQANKRSPDLLLNNQIEFNDLSIFPVLFNKFENYFDNGSKLQISDCL